MSDPSSPVPSARRAAAPLSDHNRVVLVGTVRDDPNWYDRDAGRACCFELDIESGSARSGARVPVAWLEPPRKASIVRPGARLAVVGQLHQRFFRADGRTLARMEVITTRVVPTRSRTRAESMLAEGTG